MSFDLTGDVAVVTGALGKLGPVWCSALLDAGASVVGIDLPDAAKDTRFETLERDHGPERVCLVRADVRGRDTLEAALQTCRDTVGEPTVLVNNAGIDQPPEAVASYRLEEFPSDQARAVFDVNVVGTLLCTQVFGARMVENRRGSIVNIGSMYASASPDPRNYDHIPVDPPFLKPVAYGASKAAVANMTRYFAAHWAPFGVRVNTLSPGGVAGGQDADFVAKFSARVPMGRLASAEELIGPLQFLASSASSYVTGINLEVDGGYGCW